MLPTVDRNADAYYYRYYFRFNDENMISTVLISEWIEVQYFISANRFIFIDIAAGPVVCSTELDNHNIHNTLAYEYAFGSALFA